MLTHKTSFPWSRLAIGAFLALVLGVGAATEAQPVTVSNQFLGCVAQTGDPDAYGIRDHETREVLCISPRQLREAGLIP